MTLQDYSKKNVVKNVLMPNPKKTSTLNNGIVIGFILITIFIFGSAYLQQPITFVFTLVAIGFMATILLAGYTKLNSEKTIELTLVCIGLVVSIIALGYTQAAFEVSANSLKATIELDKNIQNKLYTSLDIKLHDTAYSSKGMISNSSQHELYIPFIFPSDFESYIVAMRIEDKNLIAQVYSLAVNAKHLNDSIYYYNQNVLNGSTTFDKNSFYKSIIEHADAVRYQSCLAKKSLEKENFNNPFFYGNNQTKIYVCDN